MQQLANVFNYGERQVRTVMDANGELWFVAADVCGVLEIDTSLAVNGRVRGDKTSGGLDADEKGTVTVSTPGGTQSVLAISEPGLYSLIMKSRKPEAKMFKRWVTHEVLPTLRKTGKYEISPLEPQLPATVEEYLELDEDERGMAYFASRKQTKVLAAELEAAAPKVEAFDTFLTAENALTMNQAAKSLDIGRNTLFGILRDQRILMANNLPYQNYIRTKHFRVKQTPTKRGLKTFTNTQTLVTAKGVEFIRHILTEVGFYDGTIGKPKGRRTRRVRSSKS